MRKTLLVDGSAVVKRNLAKPQMVWDEEKLMVSAVSAN